MDDQVKGVLISDGRSRVLLYPPDRNASGHGYRHRVDIAAGPFHGTFEASAYEDPMASFRDELVALNRTLTGKAELAPSYLNLRLSLEGNGSRRITVAVDTQTFTADALPVYVSFSFRVDGGQLPDLIRQVEHFFLDTAKT